MHDLGWFAVPLKKQTSRRNRANVGVSEIERAGNAATLLKRVRYIVCAPRGSAETVGCIYGGRHTWWSFLASPASYWKKPRVVYRAEPAENCPKGGSRAETRSASATEGSRDFF